MGKRYQDALKTFDRQQIYLMDEALKLVKDNARAKFDETLEVHFRLGIDPRHSEQQIRTTVMLPHGTGKTSAFWLLSKRARKKRHWRPAPTSSGPTK